MRAQENALNIRLLVQGVVFFTWIGILIFGTNANINLLGLMIQKSFGAIFSVGVEGHFEVINVGTVYFTYIFISFPSSCHKVRHVTP